MHSTIKIITKITHPTFALFALAGFALAPQGRADCEQGCDFIRGNTFFGDNVLVNDTTGVANAAFGANALSSNTSGTGNTATGSFALTSNTSGLYNMASGNGALRNNTTGSYNVASGLSALEHNISGIFNTATGTSALFNNTIGNQNTGIGAHTLVSNISGTNNVALGFEAAYSSTTGNQNTAAGASALYHNTTGNDNTASGWNALQNNTIGSSNVAVGANALQNSTMGGNNTAIGTSAGSSLMSGSNNIYIGALGASSESNTIRVGKSGLQTRAYLAGVNGVTVAGGIGVFINSNGQLGTITSSARYKENIEPMGEASSKLLSLRPVIFRYKHELDPDAVPQFGLVAEEVAKINPDLVARDEGGKPYTVRYEAVNAMLLNEFLKEHRKVEEQAASLKRQDGKIAALETTVAELASALKNQAAQLQKVSARVEAKPQMVSVGRKIIPSNVNK